MECEMKIKFNKFHKTTIRKEVIKMKSYILKTWCIILFLVAPIVLLYNCDYNKTSGPEKPNSLDITWQQTSLRSASNGVYSDKSCNIVFADAIDGLFNSFDNGKTWNMSLPKYTIFTMAFIENGDIFAFHNTSESSVVLRSSDGGDIWNVLITPHLIYPHSLVFHQSGYIFLGDLGAPGINKGNIYRSDDNGVSWQDTSFPDSIGVYSIVSNNKGDVFAGTTRGVYRSTDYGDSWISINEGIKKVNGRPSYISELIINPVNHYIFSVDSYYDEVYRSSDNGNDWKLKSPVLHTYSSILDILINSKGEIFIAVSNNNRGPETARGVFYSADNGDNWQQVNNGLTNTNVNTVAIDSFGFLYVATDEVGIFRTVESRYK